MNKDEYNILVDIAKQWKLDGKDIDNPQQFIDDKIRHKKIEYNDCLLYTSPSPRDS